MDKRSPLFAGSQKMVYRLLSGCLVVFVWCFGLFWCFCLFFGWFVGGFWGVVLVCFGQVGHVTPSGYPGELPVC